MTRKKWAIIIGSAVVILSIAALAWVLMNDRASDDTATTPPLVAIEPTAAHPTSTRQKPTATTQVAKILFTTPTSTPTPTPTAAPTHTPAPTPTPPLDSAGMHHYDGGWLRFRYLPGTLISTLAGGGIYASRTMAGKPDLSGRAACLSIYPRRTESRETRLGDILALADWQTYRRDGVVWTITLAGEELLGQLVEFEQNGVTWRGFIGVGGQAEVLVRGPKTSWEQDAEAFNTILRTLILGDNDG